MALCTLDRDTSPSECLAAGSWSMRIGEKFWARIVGNCGETPERMGGKKSLVKMSLEESQVAMEAGTTSESCVGRGASTVDFLTPHAGASS